MSGTDTITAGERGRVVLPAGGRSRLGIEAGTRLVVLDVDGGRVLLTQEQLCDRVRRQLAGADLVDDLLAERRAAAARDDVA